MQTKRAPLATNNDDCDDNVNCPQFIFFLDEGFVSKKMRVGRFVLAKRAESRVFTVPNALTASRLLCAPLLGKAIVFGETPAAVAILGFAAFTDVADGWIARRWNQQSDLGSYLDPVADKVLATVACVALGSAGLKKTPKKTRTSC